MKNNTEDRVEGTNLMDENTTISVQVADKSNHMSAKDDDIEYLTKTIENLQGEERKLKGKDQAPTKKNSYLNTGKKAYTHPKWWIN